LHCTVLAGMGACENYFQENQRAVAAKADFLISGSEDKLTSRPGGETGRRTGLKIQISAFAPSRSLLHDHTKAQYWQGFPPIYSANRQALTSNKN